MIYYDLLSTVLYPTPLHTTPLHSTPLYSLGGAGSAAELPRTRPPARLPPDSLNTAPCWDWARPARVGKHSEGPPATAAHTPDSSQSRLRRRVRVCPHTRLPDSKSAPAAAAAAAAAAVVGALAAAACAAAVAAVVAVVTLSTPPNQ